MPYLVVAVANSFLDIAKSAGKLVDPMKVQKLVYFAHGWHLGFEQGALSAEYAQAWRWGPVFPKLYDAVKIWGSETIMDSVSAMEINPRQVQMGYTEHPLGILSRWNSSSECGKSTDTCQDRHSHSSHMNQVALGIRFGKRIPILAIRESLTI